MPFDVGGLIISSSHALPADGSSSSRPARSGMDLARNYPDKSSGYYWIQSEFMPNPLQMYVDMTEEGGGYDFYVITGGISVNSYTAVNSGTALGLDLVYPRSKYHWRAMRNFLSNVVGDTGYTYLSAVPSIYRIATTNSGDYTGYIMRNPDYYGTGAPDWRVKDGGRWWLRDSTYTEPNGDYQLGSWLGDLNNRNGLPNGYNLEDVKFNDGASGMYYTGTSYLVSTNLKG